MRIRLHPGKRLLSVASMLFFALLTFAQGGSGNKLSISTQLFLKERAGKINLSPRVKGLLIGRNDTIRPSKDMIQRFVSNPTTISGKQYISAFVRVSDDATLPQLEAKGVIVRTKFNNGLLTTYIPVDSIESVAEISSVSSVNVGTLMRKTTDRARQATNTDDVLTNSASAVAAGLSEKYDGKGVLIGVIDAGIDFNHIAFKDANGNSRIKRVYAKTSSNGMAREYSSNFPRTDNSSEDHGTHTSSTAGGSNVIINDSDVIVTDDASKATYGGMAPGADLYLVGTNDLDNTIISDGFARIIAYADQQNEPVVVSNSWGGSIGPRDGTGDVADVVNQYFGDSHPNRVCLFAASNDAGGGGMYTTGTASESSPFGSVIRNSYTISGNKYYPAALLDAWTHSTYSDDIQIKLMTVNSSGYVVSSQTVTPSSYGTSVSLDGVSGTLYVFKNYVSTGNGKTEILLYAAGDNNSGYVTSQYYLAFQIIPSTGSVAFDAWTPSGYTYFDDKPSVSDYTWTDGSDKSSVSNEATIENAIPVGAYVSRNIITSHKGSTYSLSSSLPNIGDIAYFSSYQEEGAGPTGKQIPWITAPGATIIAAVNHNHTSQSYVDDGNERNAMFRVNNSTTYPYGNMNGTSMATPCAAGIVALWLQAANENGKALTNNEVKTIMKETAITDAWTTTGSNHTHFGNGKIDALSGVQYILNHYASTEPALSVDSDRVAITGAIGKTSNATIKVKQANLTETVKLSLTDTNNVFTVSPATINAAKGTTDVTVGFTPTKVGTFTGTLTITSGALTSTVSLTGTAKPTIETTPSTLSFFALPGNSVSNTVKVSMANLSDDVKVTVSGNGFSVSSTTIAASADTTDLTVTFKPVVSGSYTGTLTLTSGTVTTKVALSGTSNDMGTASDPFLNISNYKTIDEAGWTTSTISKLYTYTEYEQERVAWLTLPVYGAAISRATQKWISSTSGTVVNRNWSVKDVFPASSSYFGTATSRAMRPTSNLLTQSFYVTNVTAAKAYGFVSRQADTNKSSLRLTVTECSLNSDGSLVLSDTPVKTEESNTNGFEGVITCDNLDASKIYCVTLSAVNATIGYAVAFQTPLGGPAVPTITATPDTLSFTTEAKTPVTKTFTVNGYGLTGDVTATLSGDKSNVFSLSATTISATEAVNGRAVTVTFSPTEVGTYSGTITLSSDGAKTQTVTLSATATEQTSSVRYKFTSDDTWHYLLPDDNGDFNITDGDYYAFEVTEDVPDATVNYTRSFTKGVWAAWNFPIDIAVDADLISNYRFGYLEGVSNEGSDIDKNNLSGVTIGVKSLTAGRTIMANLPYVVLPQVSGSKTFTITGTIKKTEPQSTQITGNAYKYISTGVYSRKYYDNDFWFALTSDGMLAKAASGAYLNPFRFYLSITDNEGNPYEPNNAIIKLVFVDETTGISDIEGVGSAENIKIYDLQGRRVYKPMHKGVYIVNGHKLVLGR